MAAFSPTVRGRKVDPVTVSRLSMMGSTLNRSIFGPCCTAMITSRPSVARHSRFRAT